MVLFNEQIYFMVYFPLIIWVRRKIIYIRILKLIWIHLLFKFFFNDTRLLVSHFISQNISWLIFNILRHIVGLNIFDFLFISLNKHDIFRCHNALNYIWNILNSFFLNAQETFFLMKFLFYDKSLFKINFYLLFVFIKLLFQYLWIQLSI